MSAQEYWIEQAIAASGKFANKRAAPTVSSAALGQITTPENVQVDLFAVKPDTDPGNPPGLKWFKFRQGQVVFWCRSDVIQPVNPLERRVAALETEVTELKGKMNPG